MHDLPLVTTLAAGFSAALILGIVTQKLGLSPIVGFLLAGIAIGPHTPGFVGDHHLAQQLAEVGVILLMFGVGLHFHPRELLAVKGIAIPGAIAQTSVATVLGLAMAVAFGWEPQAGLVIGMAMGVASTVVLIRVLTDNGMLETPHGHVAVGWLIVEDILTVVLLVVIPAMGSAQAGADVAGAPTGGLAATLALALVKLAVLVALLLVVGARVIPRFLVRVARLRSRELFTLAVLVMAVAVAAGSSYFFGVSMALGAFLAGMAVGQSPVSQQAASDALPLRDAFAVLFFVSIGMLFDPMFVVREPLLVLAALAIVLVGKPLAAILVVAILGYPLRTALTVAIGLGQIGEFSFILAELAHAHHLIPEHAMSVLVACALISITLNPILFRSLDRAERLLDAVPWIHRLMNRRQDRALLKSNAATAAALAAATTAERTETDRPRPRVALIVGYGPVGRTADRLLRSAGLETVVLDLNMTTVEEVRAAGRFAIFGDSTSPEVLRQAGIANAAFLVVTLPHSQDRAPLIATAKDLNPRIAVLARARYIREVPGLRAAGASGACIEEVEAAIALARLVHAHLGLAGPAAEEEVARLRAEFDAISAAG